MFNTVPISNSISIDEVLRHCDNGTPIYQTKNGHNRYLSQSISDYEKKVATLRLLSERSLGVESYRRKGGLTIDEAFSGLIDT